MKRILTMLLVGAVLLCCFVGCGQKPDVSGPVVSGSDVSSTTTKTTTTVDVIGGDDTTGTEDTTTGAEDTTTGTDTEDTTAGTSDTQSTSGTQGTAGTKDTTTGTKGTSGTQSTTSGTKGTTTTKNTTVTTTTTTKKTVNILPGTTTSNGGGGLTTQSSSGNNKGYEFDPGDEWTLFWCDEFNGTELDTTKWNYEVGKSYIYTEKEENVKVQNGNLVITARHANPKENQGQSFSTGAINSSNKFSFQYGRLEFRARLTYGNGVWPALWTMGDSYLTASGDEEGWPICGEIDVMEMVGGGTEAEKYTNIENQKHTGTLHWGKDRDNHKAANVVRSRLSEGILADAYHIFAIEWDENSIKFFFDDQMKGEIPLDDPTMLNSFHQKHWIIINVALYNYEPNHADETTPLPQSMYVDYVRVYKKK